MGWPVPQCGVDVQNGGGTEEAVVQARCVQVGSNRLISLASALSIFNFRVEGLEFGACVVDLELPIDPTLLLVTRRGPRGGFRRKLLGVAKPAVVHTLTRQRAQF